MNCEYFYKRSRPERHRRQRAPAGGGFRHLVNPELVMNTFKKVLFSVALLSSAGIITKGNGLPTSENSGFSVTSASRDSGKDEPKKWAVVEFSANFMRESPDYTAELGDQALMGTVVEILDKSGYWTKIKSPEPYTAWVNEMGLVPMDGNELKDYLEAPKYICTASHSHIYEEPSTDSRIASDLVLGDIVRILYSVKTHKTGHYKGYDEGRAVLRKHFAGVVLPSGKTGYVPAGDVAVFYKWAKDRKERASDPDGFRKDLLATGHRFLGVPYMWGGTSIKNVDCSGFTRSTYFANGVLLPRNASQQARIGEDIRIFSDNGDVDWKELLPGDLLFWGRAATDSTKERITHVGMYIGEGRFIHSAQVVRINSLDSSAPDFYSRRPVRARRVIGHIDNPESGIISTFLSPFYFPQR